MEDLSEIQDKIKEKFGDDITAPAARIQLCNQQGAVIDDMDDIGEEYYRKVKQGGICLVVGTLPAPTSEIQNPPQKRLRSDVEIPDLTSQFKSLYNSEISDDNFIVSVPGEMLPYPQDEIQRLYVRKCYQDIFDLLLERISSGMKSFAISGTPGIGKSLFFVYILFRLVKDHHLKSLSLGPKRVVYQMGSGYKCFDLQQLTVTELSKLEAALAVREQCSFYIIDGRTSEPLSSSCVTLFISSPRSELYKDFVKQKKAKPWYFPVWTLDELRICQRGCYPNLPIETLKERHCVYGGVARQIFDIDYSVIIPRLMEEALSDVDAVKGVRNIGIPTSIFATSHTLLHIVVSDDSQYQFRHVDIASKYVGEQLWIRQSAQMITNLQEMFGGSPSEISRHLFEIYGHLFFSHGGSTLNCRNLDSGESFQFTLESHNGERHSFGKKSIPKMPLSGYYEPSGEDNFPAIDSLSCQGMFQFTVAAEHPIRGVQILGKLCKLFDDPKIFFVVPPARFKGFKKQKCDYQGNLSQFVLELPIEKYGVLKNAHFL
jgi:hypothetical protein